MSDLIGDRVVILSEGSVQCSGTSLFLKNTYGAGYVLSIALSHKMGSEDNLSSISSLVMSFVEDAAPVCVVAGEIVFSLPFSATSCFSPLFSELDSRRVELGIVSFGISITSLEQVFVG